MPEQTDGYAIFGVVDARLILMVAMCFHYKEMLRLMITVE